MTLILSHDYQFIYIRCRKTASTSIELALSRACGHNDIVTPIRAPEDEALRPQIGGRGPQNYLNADGTHRFYNHMPASEVRLLVGQRVWDSYYKWCVERNPWDKVLSYYYHRHRNPATRPPLHTFLESGGAQRAINFRLYTIGAEVAVDHIARYEQLTTELARIAARLGLPSEATNLPRAKAESRSDRRHYSAVYTPAERDLVGELFSNEIDLHGYYYEDLSSPTSSKRG
jgi:hypothetical protein